MVMTMNFVDRVIAQLQNDDYFKEPLMYNPVGWGGFYQLFSSNYNQDQDWRITARNDVIFLTFPETWLERSGIVLNLTRAERKRLRTVADKVSKRKVLRWKQTKADLLK